MIQISFATVLMALLSSSVIIVFISLCFCNRKFPVTMGCKMFALPLGITILRLMIPVEFRFTSVIALPAPLSQVVIHLCDPLFTIGLLDISLWRIFEFIWVTGSVICLGKLIREQIVFKRMVTLYGKDVTHEGRYSEVLGEICGDRPNPFRIIEVPGVKGPVLSGVLSPYILIPEGPDLDSADFRSFLSHKTAHYFHRDILTQAGVNLMTIIYWWNPVCYLLWGQLRLVSEMPALLSNGLTDRSRMLSGKQGSDAKFLCVAIFAVTLAICLLSYCYMFEA